MGRIRFIDEMSKMGELDLEHVQAGDLVKFEADFEKHAGGLADGDGHTPEGTWFVDGGTVGEVLDVFPQAPGVLVDCPCTHRTMGSAVTGDAQFIVEPDKILLLVDTRDPRISAYRIEARQAAALKVAQRLGLPTALCGVPRCASLALYLAGKRAGARLALSAEPRVRTAAAGDVPVFEAEPWIVLMALHEARNDYEGQGMLSISKRRHVAWALRQLVDRIQDELPEHEVDWTDEDQTAADIKFEAEYLAKRVEAATDAEWTQALKAYVEQAETEGDPTLYNEFMQWSDPWMTDMPAELRTPPGQDDVLELTVNDVLYDTDAPSFTPDEPPVPRPSAEEVRAPPPPAAPPAEEPEPEPEPDEAPVLEDLDESIVLEEAGRLPPPEPAPAEPPARPDEPQAAPPATAFSAPSRYDVPAVDTPRRAPHEWAEVAARVPILVYPGFEDVQGPATRSVRVWARPGMRVMNPKTKEEGDIIRVLPRDQLEVRVIQEGVPDLEEPTTTWDAVTTRLSPNHEGVTERVDTEALTSWRRERDRRKKRERRREGHTERGTVNMHGLTLVRAIDVAREHHKHH